MSCFAILVNILVRVIFVYPTRTIKAEIQITIQIVSDRYLVDWVDPWRAKLQKAKVSTSVNHKIDFYTDCEMKEKATAQQCNAPWVKGAP